MLLKTCITHVFPIVSSPGRMFKGKRMWVKAKLRVLVADSTEFIGEKFPPELNHSLLCREVWRYDMTLRCQKSLLILDG